MVIDKLPSTDGDSLIQLHQHDTWTSLITYNIAQMSSSLYHMADLFIPSKYHSITLDFRESQDLGQHSIRLDFGHNLDCAVSDGISDKIFYSVALDWTL